MRYVGRPRSRQHSQSQDTRKEKLSRVLESIPEGRYIARSQSPSLLTRAGSQPTARCIFEICGMPPQWSARRL